MVSLNVNAYDGRGNTAPCPLMARARTGLAALSEGAGRAQSGSRIGPRKQAWFAEVDPLHRAPRRPDDNALDRPTCR